MLLRERACVPAAAKLCGLHMLKNICMLPLCFEHSRAMHSSGRRQLRSAEYRVGDRRIVLSVDEFVSTSEGGLP